MKTPIGLFIFSLFITMTAIAYGQDTIIPDLSNAGDPGIADNASKSIQTSVPVKKLKAVQKIPGGVGVRPLLHLSQPLTFWVNGREYYVQFGEEQFPGNHVAYLNCENFRQKEFQELKLDDGRLVLYCKPVKSDSVIDQLNK